MDDKKAQQASFLVRIWREKGQSGWRVWVQHIQSGEAVFVGDFGALCTFFERWVAKWDMPHRKGLK